jgi:hypothetical protein
MSAGGNLGQRLKVVAFLVGRRGLDDSAKVSPRTTRPQGGEGRALSRMLSQAEAPGGQRCLSWTIAAVPQLCHNRVTIEPKSDERQSGLSRLRLWVCCVGVGWLRGLVLDSSPTGRTTPATTYRGAQASGRFGVPRSDQEPAQADGRPRPGGPGTRLGPMLRDAPRGEICA